MMEHTLPCKKRKTFDEAFSRDDEENREQPLLALIAVVRPSDMITSFTTTAFSDLHPSTLQLKCWATLQVMTVGEKQMFRHHTFKRRKKIPPFISQSVKKKDCTIANDTGK